MKLGFGFASLILLGLLIMLLFWAFRRSRRAWPVFAGVLLIAVIFLGLVLGRSRSYIYRPEPLSQVQSFSGGAVSPLWPLGGDKPFEADIYPSSYSAAAALADEIARLLPTVMPGGVTEPKMQVSGDVASGVLTEVARALRASKNLMADEVVVLERAEGAIDDRILLRISQDTRYSRAGGAFGTETGGSVKIAVSSSFHRSDHFAKFVDKPWVDNFSAFAGQFLQGRWIVAFSPSPARNHYNAETAAMHDAFEKIRPLLRVDTTRLDEAVFMEKLRQSDIIVDRFVQSFQRPYGSLWRQAILLDISANKLTELAKTYRQAELNYRRGWLYTTISLAGMAVVIFLAYVFVNAATRGYYVWALRIAAIVLVATAAIAVFVCELI